ncbi:AraC family transcriptional regulator [Sphingobacterium sp.]|uniref:helix-turn-helix domain-containing protein n=1 Tax=Sphingobacterium sp. TaxID=341027 RepID=UPI002899B0D5|nr:AraC family transcriptional regulator [Sphingobacterium sp.]
MEILYILANSNEYTVLNSEDTSVRFILNDKVRMGTIYNYIHENFDKKPDVNEVAKNVHLSTSAFCRYFKKQTNITFTDFVNQYRISQAQRLLLQDHNISEVCYSVGFESLSYFTKLFKRITGLAPGEFKKTYKK